MHALLAGARRVTESRGLDGAAQQGLPAVVARQSPDDDDGPHVDGADQPTNSPRYTKATSSLFNLPSGLFHSRSQSAKCSSGIGLAMK